MKQKYETKPVVFRDQDKIKVFMEKHRNGDKLSDEEYFSVERYWLALNELVNINPNFFGAGLSYTVRNKALESAGCAKNRRDRIAKEKARQDYKDDYDGDW